MQNCRAMQDTLNSMLYCVSFPTFVIASSLLSYCIVAVLRVFPKLLCLNIFLYRKFLHFHKRHLFYSCGLLYGAVSNTTSTALEFRMLNDELKRILKDVIVV